MAHNDDREVTFEIIEELGIISTQQTGWKKELNLVSWNGGAIKYDIREWDPSHQRMSRGITLKEEEMRRILDIMKRRRIHGSTSTPENDQTFDCLEKLDSLETPENVAEEEIPFS